MQLQLIPVTTTKQCAKCKRVLSLTEFHRDRGKPDGLFAWCKQCATRHSADRWESQPHVKELHRSVSRRFRHSNKDRIRLIRATIGCQVCGEMASPCLDLHHLDRSTKEFNLFGVAKVKNWTDVESEVRKCACLCANCHRKVHAGLIDSDGLSAITQAQIDAALATYEREPTSRSGRRGRPGGTVSVPL